MPFAGLALHPVILRGLSALHFTEPTPIQASLIPPSLEGRDVLGLAPTGTGKTLAYVLPLAHRLLANPPALLPSPAKRGGKRTLRADPRTRLRALVLCPTRELAQQVAKDAHAVTKGSLLRVGAVWGKSPLAPHRELVSRGVDLLVGTPGRLRELLDADAMSLANIRYVVVDEADRMLDLGFLPQVEAILERMPPERQMLLLSATCPRPIERLVTTFLRDPCRVETGAHTRPASHVGQTLFEVEDPLKTALVLALVAGDRRTGVMIFVRTRRRAGWVAQALRAHGVATSLFHGDRSQAQREKALEDFAAERTTALVATDVAARGLHIPAARCVINYDVPLLPEEYVHRVGRAGHGGGSAESFTLLEPEPAERERWRRVCRLASIDLSPTRPPDLTPWLRPEDRERLQRGERRRKAASTAEAGADRTEPLNRSGPTEAGLRRHGAERPKSTKRAGKSKVQLRGGAKQKPVSAAERPGTGVRRPTPRP